jgi:hypothetical protein
MAKRPCCLIFVALLQGSALAAPLQDRAQSGWNLETVITALKQRETAVQNASVQSYYRERLVNPRVLSEPTFQKRPIESEYLLEGTWDATGRSRYSMAARVQFRDATSGDLGGFYTLRRELGNNGEETRLIEGTTNKPDERPERFQGEIAMADHAPSGPPIKPLDFTSTFVGIPLSKFFTDFAKDARVTEDSTTFGSSVVLVTIERPMDVDGVQSDTRFRAWIDPGMGFVARRLVFSIKRPQDSVFCDTGTIEASEWQEVAEDIWLPRKYRRTGLHLGAKGEAVFGDEILVENENWKVNEQLSKDWCVLSFPKGLPIVDRKRGTRYVWEQVTDKTIEEIVEHATRLLAELARRPRNSPWPVRLLVGSLSALGTFLVCYGAFRARRVFRKASPSVQQ